MDGTADGKRATRMADFVQLKGAEAAPAYGLLPGWRARICGGGGAAGQRILLLYPQGLDFISAFFATLYAGAVAVPAPHAQGTRAALARITSIIEDARPLIVLTTDALRGETAAILAQLQAGLTVCTLEDLMQSANPTAQGKLPAPESLALLQYTSGHFLRFSGPEAKRGGLMEEVVRLI